MTDGQKANIAIVIPAEYDGDNGKHIVTEIGDTAFSADAYRDYIFTSLDLTGATNLTTIGNSAFFGCSNLKGALTMPDSVKTIGMSAFELCRGLETVYLPSSDVMYGDGIFNELICPIIAADKTDYETYISKTIKHPLLTYYNHLTYETQVTFNGNGGEVKGNVEQTKLYALPR